MQIADSEMGHSIRRWVLLSFFFVFTLFVSVVGADVIGTVNWVCDGDTIVLANGDKVRYAGINAPEIEHDGRPAEPYAREALSLNKRITTGKRVRIQYDKERRDQYGRFLAYVFLENGVFVNAVLVEEGLAIVYPTPPNLKYDRQLLALQQRAIKEKRGLWAFVEAGKEAFYVANLRSRRFHRPSCEFGRKTGAGNRTTFKNRIEAFYAGFGPCKKCNP